MWMIKAEPYSDETLSSFLVRTALLNYTTLRALFATSKYTKSFYKYDLDIYRFPDDFYLWLSEKTGLSLVRLNKMHLNTYAGFLQEEVNSLSKQPWIISMGQRKGRGYRFCSYCLREKTYYRKEWRTLHVNICKEHNSYLQNQCKKCHAQVIPQLLRENMEIWQCYKCGFDLRYCEMDAVVPDKRYVLVQEQLCKIAKDGFYLVNGKPHYSTGLFDLLHHLVLHFMREKKGVDGCEVFRKVSDVQPKFLAEYIYYSMDLFDNWPFVFEKFCHTNKITNHFRLFEKYRFEQFPMWFLNEFYYILKN